MDLPFYEMILAETDETEAFSNLTVISQRAWQQTFLPHTSNKPPAFAIESQL